MIETQECANLFLNPLSISTSTTLADYPVSNSIGYINEFKTEWCWNNINMRFVMGEDMYNKYDLFNIRISQIMYSQVTTYGTSNIDRSCQLIMTGLPWVNNTYDIKLGCNTNDCRIGAINYIVNASGQILCDGNFISTFRKCDNVNIGLKLLRIDDIVPVTTIQYPNTLFMLSITGIDKTIC